MDREPVQFREIAHNSSEYRQAVALRDKLLRKPLGLRFTDEELVLESGDFHLGVFKGKRLLGCLVLSPDTKGSIRMRQVAIDESWQGRGLGRQLVLFAETFAREKSFSRIYCHARHYVIEFYRKLDYRETGEPFMEVGIPHVLMEKSLTD